MQGDPRVPSTSRDAASVERVRLRDNRRAAVCVVQIGVELKRDMRSQTVKLERENRPAHTDRKEGREIIAAVLFKNARSELTFLKRVSVRAITGVF